MTNNRAHFPELCVWLRLSQERCRGRRMRKINSLVHLLSGGQDADLKCDQDPLLFISE